jgi:hypothetical protein
MPKARHWANPKLLDNELAAGTLETTTMPRRLNTYQVLCMNTQEVGSAKRRAPRQGQPQIFGNWPISRGVDSGFGLSKTASEDYTRREDTSGTVEPWNRGTVEEWKNASAYGGFEDDSAG